MGYLYRYIDLNKEEVVYVGKVMGCKDIGYDPLTRRHEQHKRDEWYKVIGEQNLLMQYIECSATDADILETWLINFYAPTGQLYNKGKSDWGESDIDLYSLIFGRWRNYGINQELKRENIDRQVRVLVDALWRQTEGITVNLENGLSIFAESIHKISAECNKANKISRFSTNDEFKRQVGDDRGDGDAHGV